MDSRQLLGGLGLVAGLAGIGVIAYLNKKRDEREEVDPRDLGLDKDTKRAFEKYEEVNWGQKADKVVKVAGKRKKMPKVLVEIGDLEAVVYKSGKSGKPERYLHFFENPSPMLTTTTDGQELFIVGGKAFVDKRGIVG